MGLRPSSPPPLLPVNERIASRISREDVVIYGISVGIGMTSIFDGADVCLDCRLSSTSGVMSHNMSSDATVRTAFTNIVNGFVAIDKLTKALFVTYC